MLNVSVMRRSVADNPIRKYPSDTAEAISSPCVFGDVLLVEQSPSKSQGDWIKVSVPVDPENCYMPKEKPNQIKKIYGWIKWKAKGRVLIDLLLLC
jgi:hypothetical protein